MSARDRIEPYVLSILSISDYEMGAHDHKRVVTALENIKLACEPRLPDVVDYVRACDVEQLRALELAVSSRTTTPVRWAVSVRGHRTRGGEVDIAHCVSVVESPGQAEACLTASRAAPKNWKPGPPWTTDAVAVLIPD